MSTKLKFAAPILLILTLFANAQAQKLHPKIVALENRSNGILPILAGPPETVTMKSGYVVLDPGKSVAVIEAGRIGAGASGRTGGMALGETAAGDLPGLGDVLDGFEKILRKLNVECELALPGAWEIGRSGAIERSPIEWQDSGTLRVVTEVPGGTLDPGKLVSGLARAAENLGAGIFEISPVERIHWGERMQLEFAQNRGNARKLTAGKIFVATNSLSLGLAGQIGRAHV